MAKCIDEKQYLQQVSMDFQVPKKYTSKFFDEMRYWYFANTYIKCNDAAWCNSFPNMYARETAHFLTYLRSAPPTWARWDDTSSSSSSSNREQQHRTAAAATEARRSTCSPPAAWAPWGRTGRPPRSCSSSRCASPSRGCRITSSWYVSGFLMVVVDKTGRGKIVG